MTVAYPLLPKSYRSLFPFKISVPSYIYPDHMITNVRHIGPFVDEIELLLFESHPDSLPGADDIKELVSVSHDMEIDYNVHLPIDIYLGSRDSAKRRQAVETLLSIFDLTSPLTPTAYTLHLEYDPPTRGEDDVMRWQENIQKSFQDLFSEGIAANHIAIETLAYPFAWIERILSEFPLFVCIDIGHLLKEGENPEKIFAFHEKNVMIMHLHGLDGNHDHQPLEMLSEYDWKTVLPILKRFLGVLCLEVFSFDYLKSSLDLLERRFFCR
ncbi:MAG: TIM barrel protein [Deltaproteobacteria bacterium]|nr:TIM barrel protein [Deltaproteobacteria bacterium]